MKKKNKIVKVKINGKEFNTIIDSDKVQRFPTDSLIRHLVDTKQVDLNGLSIDYQKGKFTLEEYQAFYMGMGYSLCGFEEVFGQGNIKLKIKNPLWK